MSDDKNQDILARLRGAEPPPPSAAARQRAIDASQAAFAAQQQKSATPAKGSGWGARLRTIITSLKGISIMDLRLPIGTAAIALLVLPLGYQLYSSTSMTPAERAAEQADPVSAAPATGAAEAAVAQSEAAARPLPQSQPEQAPLLAPQLLPITPAPLSDTAGSSAGRARAGSMANSTKVAAPDLLGGSLATAPAAEMAGDSFSHFEEQRLKVTAEAPVSTFSIDVDTASYVYVRRALEDGYLPPADAVRIEEMVNYFPYDYPAAESAAVPFKPTMAVFPTPWNADTQLLQIGIKGYVPPAGADRPSNLVFLIDTSGSMDEPDKLPLLKRAFGLLIDQLSDNDTVSIVAYAGSAGVVLEPTAANHKARILTALDQLAAGGGTAGAEGITLAYQLAEQAKVAGGTNRVILATDGDFNIGIDDPALLEDFIRARREGGITLSVLGFGRGNLDDATMQALAQNGNGNASYIANFAEARKVLVEEMGGTLDMIAKDVKIQIEFNPALVSEYRLIGYETRMLNREDFSNDAVDAGDVGAGTTVTALYEITPAGSGGERVAPLRYGPQTAPAAAAGDEIAFLKMRYKLPDSQVSQLIEAPVTPELVYGDIAEVSGDMRFAAAVAAFGQKLRGSVYTSAMGWADIEALARAGKGSDPSGYRAEFINLVKTAGLLKPEVGSDTCDAGVTGASCN